MTNKKSQSTTSPSTAKSTPKTGKTSTDCITPKSDEFMKSDITPNSVDPAMPVNTANSDVAVNSNDRNTPDNNANLFNNEQSATPQPKQQRVGIKQRKLEFGEYKETYLIPVKIVKRHSLNISDATWERLERYARILDDRGANVGSYAERIICEHLDLFGDDLEAWRKL